MCGTLIRVKDRLKRKRFRREGKPKDLMKSAKKKSKAKVYFM